MARSSECTDSYAQKVLDAADIVRDAMLRQLRGRMLFRGPQTYPMKHSFMLLLSLLVGIALSCKRAQATPEDFWKWFQSNEDTLFNFEKNREQTFDKLGAEMHKLNPSLTFEFGPIEDGKREFVISADGIKE